jgi:hypothetical protein
MVNWQCHINREWWENDKRIQSSISHDKKKKKKKKLNVMEKSALWEWSTELINQFSDFLCFLRV